MNSPNYQIGQTFTKDNRPHKIVGIIAKHKSELSVSSNWQYNDIMSNVEYTYQVVMMSATPYSNGIFTLSARDLETIILNQ